MFEAILKNKILSLDQKDGNYTSDGKEIDPDIEQISPNEWHILFNNKSYSVFVHSVDKANNTADLSINGKRTVVKIRSKLEKLLQEMGLEGALEQKIDSIKAPMPGLIREIYVKPGDTVKKGDPVFILEAMKMENIIKSPGDGVIAGVNVKVQDSVEKNETVLSFE